MTPERKKAEEVAAQCQHVTVAFHDRDAACVACIERALLSLTRAAARWKALAKEFRLRFELAAFAGVMNDRAKVWERRYFDCAAENARIKSQHERALLDAPADVKMGGLSVGARVEKRGGDYTFEGVVVAAFHKRGGEIRFVVENDAGILHIFSEKNLERAP